MKLGAFIKARRIELGLTQAAIAKAVGVSRVSVTQWESGETSPKGMNLLNLARALKLDVQDIKLGAEGKKADVKSFERRKGKVPQYAPFSAWDDDDALEDDEVEVPLYLDVELSAGNGNAALNEYTDRKLRFAKSTLRKMGVDPASAVCVRVDGTSMEPVLPDGSVVGIDRADLRIRDGKMYAVRHEDLLRVKVVHRLPGGGLRLVSYNSDYPDEIHPNAEQSDIEILGRVFWYSVLI